MSSRHMTTRFPRSTATVAALFVAITLVACSAGNEREVTRSGPVRQPYQSVLGAFGGTAEEPGYPDQWRVHGIPAARAAVDFNLLVPDHPVANSNNLMAAFIFPDGAVALDFPAPVEPLEYVRQEYIEVYQAQWFETMSPQQSFEIDIKNAPSPAKELTEINGIPALTVEAHSTNDDERANPAFVKFVLDGVEIQVSGGEDLQILVEVAQSLIAQAV